MSWGRFSFNTHKAPSRMPWTRDFPTQKSEPCTVVLSDGDDDSDGTSDLEILIIEGAAAGESASAAGPSSQVRKGNHSFVNVINIDDEDEKGGAGGDKAGPSMSRASVSPATMTPGRGSPGNRYGLDSMSDSSESDLTEGYFDIDDGSSDCEILNDTSGTARKAWETTASDCEILDDTSGIARKVWETAASRKKPSHGVHECKDAGTTASASCAGLEKTQPDRNSEHLFGAECRVDEGMSGFYSAASKHDSQNSSGDTKEGPGHPQSSAGNAKGVNGPSVPNAEGVQNNTGRSKDGHDQSSVLNIKKCSMVGSEKASGRVQSLRPDENSEHLFGAECHVDEGMSWFYSAASKHDPPNSSGDTKEGPGRPQSSAGNAEGVNGPSVPNAEAVQNNTGRSKDGHDQSSVPNVKKCSMVGSEKASGGVQSPCLDENSTSAKRVFSGISSTDRKDGSPPISVSTPEKVDEKIPEDVYSQKDHSPPEASYNTNICSAQDNGHVRGEDLLQNSEELRRFASVIGEREKHKETVEYKRAAEEEWASRQRQLQIQAEEAKKLRKRKKAEAQRLLDMEKRQKQRLQEVRESQRKNEEAIQLKEQYRGTVRKELEDMERRYYWDMPSILHALGISVEGGEVKAFKQALLKFHPDRVSSNDIYQQVKAEETFKFISRLKEKLPRLS